MHHHQQDENEVIESSYKSDSDTTVQLVVGSKTAACKGKKIFMIEELTAPDSYPVSQLNDTLISVGQVFDNGKIAVFPKNKGRYTEPENSFSTKKDVTAVEPKDA